MNNYELEYYNNIKNWDYIIDNNSDYEHLKNQVLNIAKKL